MANNSLKKIAIVGASGNVGAATLRHLLETNPDVTVTVVTRQGSKATFPSSPQVIVKKGSYEDDAFWEDAFKGNDLVLLTLAYTAMELQPKMIEAAAKAGVKWIIPNEFGADGENDTIYKSNHMLLDKAAARKQVEELAKTYKGLNWIGVATNPWTELSIGTTFFGINAPERTVTLWSETGKFNSSSQEQVGRGIAALISLPVTNTGNPRASLEHYAQRFVYISSYLVTQQDLFDAVKRATDTSDADWKILRSSNAERISTAKEQMAAGNFMAVAQLMYAYYMGDGLGGNYESKAKEDQEVLGLKEEKLDDVVKAAIAGQS